MEEVSMKPVLIVHCKGTNELENLLSQLEELGYAWNGDRLSLNKLINSAGNYIHIYNNDFGKVIRYSNSCLSQQYIEFSSLKNKFIIEFKNILA